MTWPRDPNCPEPITSCSVLGHIPVDKRCVICDAVIIN